MILRRLTQESMVCSCLNDANVEATILDCFFCRLSEAINSPVFDKASRRDAFRA